MITVKSEIGLDYITIRITKSRIDKGLLAIPVSLLDWFPKEKTKLNVFFNENAMSEEKNFTPYTSSSRECRIGGLSDWFSKNMIKDSDEIVIQLLDREEKLYRLIPEKSFVDTVKQIRSQMRHSKNEKDIEEAIHALARETNLDRQSIITNEFLRLSQLNSRKRKYEKANVTQSKENVPVSVRILLAEIYQGRCQVSDFTFIQKNGRPYFEIHHINPDIGNHIKNILVVSPNVHAQFTHANCEEFFDDEGWLREVKFNETKYKVRQFIDDIKKREFIKQVYLE
jgi:hypothetical protein